MSYKVGMAKEIITPFFKGVTMLGYGKLSHRVESVKKELHARSCFIQVGKSSIVFCNLEIAFISHLLRQEILKNIKKRIPHLDESNLIINAQHTHSAPGGFNAYGFYNMPNKGLCRKVVETYVQKTADCIYKSFQNLKPCKNIFYKEDEFPLESDVAFNRSMLAYLKNIENRGLKNIERNKAVDRRVKILEFRDERHIGFINIFGVHATSVGSQNRFIHPDNKGDAALKSEEDFPNSVCIYMQGNAGDISPNFIKQKTSYREYRGIEKDDCVSSLFNGTLQAEFSKKIINQKEKIDLNPVIQTSGFYLNFTNLKASKQFEDFYGKKDLQTTSGYIGTQMLRGSVSDGKSMNALTYKVLEFLFKKVDKKSTNVKHQKPKIIAVDTGNGFLAGMKDPKKLHFLKYFDPLVKIFFKQLSDGALKSNKWIQETHYLNLVKIDSILILSIPMEPTTMAGIRLENDLLEKTNAYGIKKVIIMPYSNSYCGYLTTPEEYQYQDYEGGHSIFGKWTLPCLQTEIAKRTLSFLEGLEVVSDNPPVEINTEELNLRVNETY